MKIKRTKIKKDLELSPRIEHGTIADVVKDYEACYDQMPPIVVFKVPDDEHYILVDGWHRLTAAEHLEIEEVEADVKYGTRNQAKEYALLANLHHGVPLTRKEKRHVVTEFLKLHPERSNSWIASDLATTDKSVEAARKKLESTSEFPRLEWLVGRDGKNRPRTLQIVKAEDAETGDAEEIEEDVQVDDVPEPEPVIVIPVLGPYELNEVHQADCRDALQQLPEAGLDLVLADPPYNLGKNYGAGSSDRLPDDEYFRWCMGWFMGVCRSLKPGGAFYVMHYPEVAARWKQQLDGIMTFQRWITWVYPCNIGHTSGNWSRAQRTILYYVKGSRAAFFEGKADPQPYRNPDDMRIKHLGEHGTVPYDWWEYNLVKNTTKGKTDWPNQLPEPLVKRIIVTSCPKDGVVCDPFMGSGTTAAVAKDAGRDWIGFDIEERACNITKERIADE